MKHKDLFVRFIAVSLSVTPTSSAFAVSPTVDVLVAFAPDVYAQNRQLFVTSLETDLNNIIMVNSGMSSKDFRIREYQLPALHSSGSTGTTADALNAIRNDPILQAARNTGQNTVTNGVTSFDLVFLVVPGMVKPGTTTQVCGIAQALTTVNPPDVLAAERDYLGAISTNGNCGGANRMKVMAHELGHLFAGEHQVQQGETLTSAEDDDPSIPVSYNHPVFNYSSAGTLIGTSVMASSVTAFPMKRQFSSSTGNLEGTSQPAGNSTQSNMRFLIQFKWTDIAAYRPLPPPPTVFCYDPPLFLGCPYGCMSSPYLMQWGGQNASSFVVQKSGFSGWSNWYSGTNTSSFASTGTIYHEYFRVKAVNASGVDSGWCNMTLYVQCSEEMDPW